MLKSFLAVFGLSRKSEVDELHAKVNTLIEANGAIARSNEVVRKSNEEIKEILQEQLSDRKRKRSSRRESRSKRSRRSSALPNLSLDELENPINADDPPSSPRPAPSFTVHGNSNATGSNVVKDTNENNADSNNIESNNESNESNNKNSKNTTTTINNAANPQSSKKRIMISYNVSSTKHLIPQLRKALEDKYYTVWNCETDIAAGKIFRAEIAKAALSCDFMICLINKEWAQSGECMFEYDAVQTRANKPDGPVIIPVMVGNDVSWVHKFPIVDVLMKHSNCIFAYDEKMWKYYVAELATSISKH